MRRVPWQVSLRYSRKGGVTVIGIALAMAFALASFSMADALERSAQEVARHHGSTTRVIASETGERFSFAPYEHDERAIGLVVGQGTDERGRVVPLVAAIGPSAPPSAPTARPNGWVTGSQWIVVQGARVQVGPTIDYDVLPRGWFLVPAEALGNGDAVDVVIITEAPFEEIGGSGRVAASAPALQGFFRASAIEVARDLLLVVAFSSVLAALFCYEFIRSEVRESRREIGILRALGARRREIVLLFLGRSAVIAVAAVAVAWAFAALTLPIANSVATAGKMRFDIEAYQGLVISAAFAAATLLGGVVPAYSAGRMTVRAAMEERA